MDDPPRYNPKYKKPLSNNDLNSLLEHVVYPFRSLEKKVYYAQMWKDHEGQIRQRVEANAKLIKGMKKAERWKERVYGKFEEYSGGVAGYSYDKKKHSLIITNKQYKTFRISQNNAFSGTFESTSRLERAGGYIAAALVIGFTLYCCWQLKKTLPKMIEMFDPPTTTIEQLLDH